MTEETKIDDVETIATVDPSAHRDGDRPSVIPNEEPPGLASDPQPAQTVTPPGPENLPPASSVIAKRAAEIGLRIVDAERDGNSLFLVVEGDNVEDVQSFDARMLAYDARFHYGFDNAGLEPVGGSSPTKDGHYRQTWKLLRGL